MLDQFRDIEQTYSDIERKISDPEIIADQKKYQSLLKRHAELKEGVTLYRELRDTLTTIEETEVLKEDPEMSDYVSEELAILNQKKETLSHKLHLFLIPKDPNDEKNAIIEIRQGTGGDEAALFAGTLYRMYLKYADTKNWTVDILSESTTGLGGIKEVIFSLSGPNVFGTLKFESGTHRVQRVPDTESSGRVHTSAATVAIMAEAEEVDFEINMKDCRIDTYRASGAGGQHVNKTDSAVRITHLPTGAVSACQDERSQFQNKEKAIRLLRTKLYELHMEKTQQEQSAERKIQVGSGDRSQKIRTYNYPQNRVTDHRINLVLYDLDNIIEGKLSPLTTALIEASQLEKMKR